MSGQLYRHFDATGRLLYVGISLCTLTRLGQHADQSEWFSLIARVTIERFPTRLAALEAERRAIAAEHPVFNLSRPKDCEADLPDRYSPFEASSRALTMRIVGFEAVYTFQEAAKVLRTTTETIKRLIEAGDIGFIEMPSGPSMKRRITGWQLIEYFEHLETSAKAAKLAGKTPA